jgi:hypothetical protein
MVACCPPRLATEMTSSYDRTRGSIPCECASDYGARCRTPSLKVVVLFRLGPCRHRWRLRGWCLGRCFLRYCSGR